MALFGIKKGLLAYVYCLGYLAHLHIPPAAAYLACLWSIVPSQRRTGHPVAIAACGFTTAIVVRRVVLIVFFLDGIEFFGDVCGFSCRDGPDKGFGDGLVGIVRIIVGPESIKTSTAALIVSAILFESSQVLCDSKLILMER